VAAQARDGEVAAHVVVDGQVGDEGDGSAGAR
jgi:hypothetical protein